MAAIKRQARRVAASSRECHYPHTELRSRVLEEVTMGLLEGKVAIITGASKGIGRVMATRFGREGARVVCAARSAELVKATAAQVQEAGAKAIAVVGDAAIEDDVRRIVAEAPRRSRHQRPSTARATAARPSPSGLHDGDWRAINSC